ncbi:MAG: cation:proton antiporter [Patescibacteria group bacterium]|jgi:Kef-type K+ transport system membrane component KefB|nr:cation:proton antiporter [Patescibacteria group bacterium]
MVDSIFLNISIILGVAIAVSFLVQLLKQPLIISYIITGILVGPVFLNIINSSQEYFHIFAEFGVILLLFLVGLSLNFHFLKKIGKVAAVTGGGQVLFTALVGFLILTWLGFDREFSTYLAIAITFSSTIIIMKLLAEKRETETVYGRYTVGLMLIQDIIAIVLLMMLPAFKEGGPIAFSLTAVLLKSTLFLMAIYLTSRIILLLLNRVAKSGEFLLIFTIAWCFSVAGLAEWVGLSLEVGAIVAGLSLGSSIYREEITSRLKPLRDFFIVMFFIILGSEMNIGGFGEVIVPGIILSLFVLIGNPFILYVLYRTMKFSRRVSFRAGLTAAQVSEFGFVFLFVVEQQGFMNSNLLPLFTFVALVTIFISSYLIMYNGQIYKKMEGFLRLFGKDKYSSPEEKLKKYDVLVFGYHRIGWKVVDALSEMKVNFAVVDFDPIAIEKLKTRNVPCFFGDATDIELLSELPLASTKMIISTLPSSSCQVTMIKHVRESHSKPIIIGTLSYVRFLNEMYEAGADYVMMPHLIAGDWLANILKGEDWNRKTTKKLVRQQREQMLLKHTLPV